MAIYYAANVLRKIIRELQTDGVNEGCVSTFGNTYATKQAFTSDPAVLYNCLNTAISKNANATNRILYDAVFNTIEYFHSSAKKSNRWVIFVITYENDEGSGNVTSIRQCIDNISERYHGRGCIYIISVGNFNRARLNKLDIDNRCSHISADTPQETDRAILKALLRFQTNDQRGNWSDVAAFENISYAFVLDVSSQGYTGNTPPHTDKLCFNEHVLHPVRHDTEW
eukprot:CAMPEP_0206138760 /NCGR_PEP_ID=MMETSP1473-20131121/3543_1 /ASSEMBLY_ACC=CAM_ASM_001109 /TAXON_ID=1461547 /ORGANISM="Stichococcus sp, Strain RCC1054" /LENGTH=225 /DNA_ID=CAMNT_0053532273 /DNA_START=3922 /DNA_END=4596 /DNA_ORIENTATION=-